MLFFLRHERVTFPESKKQHSFAKHSYYLKEMDQYCSDMCMGIFICSCYLLSHLAMPLVNQIQPFMIHNFQLNLCQFYTRKESLYIA